MLKRKSIARAGAAIVPVVAAVALMAASNNLTVRMNDECDAGTFNAMFGAGACVGSGKVTVQEFLTQFAATGSVKKWEFKKDEAKVKNGVAIDVQNRGGELHTFTRVDEFGGGIIPDLNDGAAIRPECGTAFTLAPQSGTNVVLGPGGAGTTDPLTASGTTVKFMCCIHPWMQAEVRVQ